VEFIDGGIRSKEAGIPGNHCESYSPQLGYGHKRHFRMLRMRFGNGNEVDFPNEAIP
jgi:hypothetical protein